MVSKRPADISRQFRCTLVSSIFVLLQCFADDDLDIAFERGIVLAEFDWIGVLNDSDNLVDCFVFEIKRDGAGQNLIEHDTKRVDIRSCVEVHGIADRLFGTHVVERSDQLADIGFHRGAACIRIRRTRNTKVEDFGFTIRIYQHIRRFEVAVDDPLGMCMLDRVAEFDEEFELCMCAELVVDNVILKFLSRDILHREVRRTRFLVDPRFMDLRDVRMVQPTEDFRFKIEPPHRFG